MMHFELIDLFLILLGLFAGILGTMIGAGGGFILVPVLILLWPDKNREIITSVSLAVVFVNAFSGSVSYLKMKRVDIKSGLIFAAATVPGAILGAHSTKLIPRKTFDLIFGILMIIIAVFLFVRSSKVGQKAIVYKKGVHRHIIDREGTEHKYHFHLGLGIGISLFIGFISSFFGIGGGIIHVPVLVGLLNFPVHIATATSHFTLAISALAGTIEHIIEGTLDTVIWQTLFISLGVYFGAKIGAKLSTRVHGNFIIRGAAIALGIVGIRILYNYVIM
jgi:uncharacterized protein